MSSPFLRDIQALRRQLGIVEVSAHLQLQPDEEHIQALVECEAQLEQIIQSLAAKLEPS